MAEATVAAGKVHEFTTKSGADTVEVGRKLVKLLKPPQLLLLTGDLGTGKTTLVKGIAQALEAAEPDEVTSPTFTLLHEYEGVREGKPVKLYHLDVYRLEGERQLETLGLDDLLTDDALVLVEWGEKFRSLVKRATGGIVIESKGGDARKITVTLKEERCPRRYKMVLNRNLCVGASGASNPLLCLFSFCNCSFHCSAGGWCC